MAILVCICHFMLFPTIFIILVRFLLFLQFILPLPTCLWNFKNNFGFICYKWFCLEYSKNAHALILLSINSYLIENVCENTKGHVTWQHPAKYHSPWMQGKESHEDLQTYIFDFFFNLLKTIPHECRERKIIKIKNTHFWFFKWDV